MKRKHRSWITLWMIPACILLLAIGTYAAYTSVQYAKGVAVAKSESKEIRFSSNYLVLRNDGDIPLKLISASGDSVSVAITVCNYTQNEPDKAHKTDIAYTLMVELLDASGNALGENITYQKADGTSVTMTKTELLSKLKVNGTGFTENQLTLQNQNLTGSTPTQNVYTLTCTSPDVLSALSIKMTATPGTCEECELDKYLLVGRLKILTSENKTKKWTGHITDDPGVDAFNYELSGTAVAEITLTWDRYHVAPSKWSLEELGISEYPSGNSVAIQVGGTGKPTSYRLQFYRTSPIPESESKEDLKGYISLN